jgi:hypothetical protein
MEIYRTGAVLSAPRILYDEPNLDRILLSKIFRNWTFTLSEEIAPKRLTRAESPILIAAVVEDPFS